MSKSQCVTGCGRPTKATMLCRTCLSHLQRDLGDIDALAQELEITSTRQSVSGARNGSRSTTRPLPFNWSADHDLDDLRLTLVGWVRDLAKTDGDWPADTIPAMARWLLAHSDDIAKHLAADAISDEIHYAVAQAYRAIDRRADRWYAGPCRGEYTPAVNVDACCLADLYADPAAELVVCEHCRTVHHVEERRAWLVSEANDQLAHAALIADALSGLGYTVTSDRIRKWAERGRIEEKGSNLRGDPTYRVGDVIDRLAEDMGARERRARRAS